MRIVFLVMMLLSFLPAAAYGSLQDKRCDQCGKRLKKRYIQNEKKQVFCSQSCVKKTMPRCSVCQKTCEGRYLVSPQGNYCSQACLDKTLPRCGNCSKVCRKGYVKAKNKHYCSQECAREGTAVKCMRCGKPFNAGMKVPNVYGEFLFCKDCSKAPKCLVCERPVKQLRRQNNGSYLCKDCDVNVIRKKSELDQLFREVKLQLGKRFNFKFDHFIALETRHYGMDPSVRFVESGELGFFHYTGREIITTPGVINLGGKKPSVRYENEKCSIVIMDWLPRRKAAEVLAHELAHDYMRHRWYYINDTKVQEGFAEFVASEYNIATGSSKWNYRMELSRDPVYGEGYRMVRAWYKKGGWQEIVRRLNNLNYRNMPPELR